MMIDGNVFIVRSAVEFLWDNRAVPLKSFRRILGTGYSAINELRRLPASRQLSKNGLPIRWKNHFSVSECKGVGHMSGYYRSCYPGLKFRWLFNS